VNLRPVNPCEIRVTRVPSKIRGDPLPLIDVRSALIRVRLKSRGEPAAVNPCEIRVTRVPSKIRGDPRPLIDVRSALTRVPSTPVRSALIRVDPRPVEIKR